ncbi:hypothetical protein SAMN04488544_1225 [Microlunatus sagamiharensis]|uniref:Mannose-6-phosphate isomerase n=1 Tax=Microlunatus sagamiharensis TaxID=546874 RepID=A0A1H2M1C5_9ACTN|nr:hypothetical protein [Microlunatus sagamiharensis]SDU86959.1 hypothetical protein SAMN04488544_1225 [Microlunatus sagamiharensis]
MSPVREEWVRRLVEDAGGVLALEPAWVARSFLPPGRRLGLAEDAYDLGVRGAVCERWLASTTPADNAVPHPDEGLSALRTPDGRHLLLADLVREQPALVLGEEYAATHPAGLGRLAKIFDYAARLPFHVHPAQEYAARVGRHQKDEAYHFLPGADQGAHPETFLGVQPHVARGPREEALLPHLVAWDSDLVLTTSQAYLQVPGEGFMVPSGVLHGPGTALTLELQEDSDVLSMFQALNAGKIIDKDQLLYKDVAPVDREAWAERAPLAFVDWARNGDPDLFARAHLRPLPHPASTPEARRDWVFHGSTRFSGQRLVLAPGAATTVVEPGAYSVFAWTGSATWGGVELAGGRPGEDEALVVHAAATRGTEVRSTGTEPFTAYVFSGPNLHPEAALLAPGWAG